jgi:amino acid transporter
MVFTGTSGNLRCASCYPSAVRELTLLCSAALYIACLVEIGSGRQLTRVEIAAVAWAINIASGVVNTLGTKTIGRMSAFCVWWTLAGTLVVVAALLAAAPTKNSAAFVFTDYEKCAVRPFGRRRLAR